MTQSTPWLVEFVTPQGDERRKFATTKTNAVILAQYAVWRGCDRVTVRPNNPDSEPIAWRMVAEEPQS